MFFGQDTKRPTDLSNRHGSPAVQANIAIAQRSIARRNDPAILGCAGYASIGSQWRLMLYNLASPVESEKIDAQAIEFHGNLDNTSIVPDETLEWHRRCLNHNYRFGFGIVRRVRGTWGWVPIPPPRQ